MTSFSQALYKFWSNFGMPAYQADMVPDGTPFPYVTFETVYGSPFGANFLTARMWKKDKIGDNAMPHVASFLEQVKSAIPPQGVKLEADGGFFILYPNTASFLSYETDPSTENESLKLITGRVSCEIHYYL